MYFMAGSVGPSRSAGTARAAVTPEPRDGDIFVGWILFENT